MPKRRKANKLIIVKKPTKRGDFFSYAMAHVVMEYNKDKVHWYENFCKNVKDQTYGFAIDNYLNVDDMNSSANHIRKHLTAKLARVLLNGEQPNDQSKWAMYDMLVRIVAGEEPNKIFDYSPKRGKGFIFDEITGSKAACYYYLLSKDDHSIGAVIDTAKKFNVAKKTVEDYLQEFRLSDDMPACVLQKFSEIDILYDIGRLDPFTLLNWRN